MSRGRGYFPPRRKHPFQSSLTQQGAHSLDGVWPAAPQGLTPFVKAFTGRGRGGARHRKSPGGQEAPMVSRGPHMCTAQPDPAPWRVRGSCSNGAISYHGGQGWTGWPASGAGNGPAGWRVGQRCWAGRCQPDSEWGRGEGPACMWGGAVGQGGQPPPRAISATGMSDAAAQPGPSAPGSRPG